MGVRLGWLSGLPTKVVDQATREAFREDLRNMDMATCGIAGEGIVLSSWEEHALHEFCHVVTASLDLHYEDRTFSYILEDELRAHRKGTANYELRTLAAELVILKQMEWVTNLDTFIGHLERTTKIKNIEERLRTRLFGRRKRLAQEDASSVIVRIKEDARRLRESVKVAQ